MAKLIFLGTASAVAYKGHENTFLVLKGEESSILVDCSSRPVVRLKEAGIDYNDLSDLIITHFHPDHVSGLAILIMDMWILGSFMDQHIRICRQFNCLRNRRGIGRISSHKLSATIFNPDTYSWDHMLNR